MFTHAVYTCLHMLYLCVSMCWLLNNMSLNYISPLTHGFFFSINKYCCTTGTVVGWICRCRGNAGYGALTVKIYLDFWLGGGINCNCTPSFFQGSTIYTTHTHRLSLASENIYFTNLQCLKFHFRKSILGYKQEVPLEHRPKMQKIKIFEC